MCNKHKQLKENLNLMTVPEKMARVAEVPDGDVHTIRADWDEEGVYFYQAYNQKIADFALETGNFGGEGWNPERMSWIKPSFGWMLYRAGYGSKDRNQERILRIKLSHSVLAEILTNCCLASSAQMSGDPCRVQWDPERDLAASQMDKRGQSKEPRKMENVRSIQIGISKEFSIQRVAKLNISDVTDLARAVGEAHNAKTEEDCRSMMSALAERLPLERPYQPRIPEEKLRELKLLSSVE